MTIVWSCITILAIFIEIITPQLISLWFIGGGIVAIILSLINGISWIWQLIAFILTSTLLLVFIRPIVAKVLKIGKESRSNIDEFISKKVRMLSEANFDNMGTAKINGVIWNVVSIDDNPLKEGTIVEIVKVSGNKLIAKPCTEEDKTTATL